MERLRTLLLAAGALALFYILMFPHPQPADDGITPPLSTESRPEGYQALWRWLKQQRIPGVSLRNRYDHLPALLRKPTGNVLILTMPHRMPATGPELDDLSRWVERGNTLLIMAALEDTPVWAIGADPLMDQHLERVSGLKFERPREARRIDLKSLGRTGFEIHPLAPHPLTAGVRTLAAPSALPLRRAVLQTGLETIPLRLAARADTGDTVLWLTARDAGQVIVSTAAGLFANGAVAQGDNARLLANILAWSLKPGGAVIFDDAHQGLTDIYGARRFFADPRLHHTLEWILLLWLVLVLGSPPLRAVQRRWRPADEASYVEAGSRYLAAVVPTDAAAQRLVEKFLNRLTGAPGAAGFEVLDAHAGVPQHERALLHSLYARACAGRRVRLTQLQNLLSQLRRNFE